MDIPVEVGVTPALGIRGLLAARDITAGDVIERCPVVLIPVGQEAALEATVLANYYFLWDDDHYALALGYGSLHNHSYAANVTFELDYAAAQIVFSAVRDVRRGEELTINYNGDPDDETPLHEGFDVQAL
ncbi:MAG: SET domain-containing protein-lysine N-methyltransferase [Anaerolineae bacterium]|nr:SET domain-containing protein-lysine N-methyltransferase [Anaerolineae bacterium]